MHMDALEVKQFYGEPAEYALPSPELFSLLAAPAMQALMSFRGLDHNDPFFTPGEEKSNQRTANAWPINLPTFDFVSTRASIVRMN